MGSRTETRFPCGILGQRVRGVHVEYCGILGKRVRGVHVE